MSTYVIGRFKPQSRLDSKLVIRDADVIAVDKSWTVVRDLSAASAGPVRLADMQAAADLSRSAFSPRSEWEREGLIESVKVPGERTYRYRLTPIPEP